jgi:hypothetical protein
LLIMLCWSPVKEITALKIRGQHYRHMAAALHR